MPLKSLDFPLDFKICFQPARFNETVLKFFGYADMAEYTDGTINGLKNQNGSHILIGWGGNQSFRVKDAGEILHAARYDWAKGCHKKTFFLELSCAHQIWSGRGFPKKFIQNMAQAHRP